MILFNTDLDGVPASGVALKNIHHLTFIPKTTTIDPELPSGSLWLRPYDGAMEMFTYQGTSGIFEVLNGQGYASYHQSSNRTFSTSVPVLVEFQHTEVQDSDFISANVIFPVPGTDFTINANGLYQITYNLKIRNATGGGNSDGRAQTRALVNGSEIAGSNTKVYFGIPSAAGRSQGSVTLLVSLNVGDVVQFEIEILTGGGSAVNYLGFVSFELIRPEVP